MKRISLAVVIPLVVAIFSVTATAQSSIGEEKNKLITEIVSVMKLDQQFPMMMDTILRELEKTYPLGFAASVDANDALNAEQKAALKATADKRYIEFSQKFRKRLSEKVDYGKYIQEAVYPLYDKFYTEQELKDLIVFYKTPTGQKLIKTLPELLAESTKLSNEKFVPQILPIIQELLKEEFEQLGAPPKTSNK